MSIDFIKKLKTKFADNNNLYQEDKKNIVYNQNNSLTQSDNLIYPKIMIFVMNGCFYCTRFKKEILPLLEDLHDRYKNNFSIEIIEREELINNPQKYSNFDVRGFPNIFFVDVDGNIKKFENERTFENIITDAGLKYLLDKEMTGGDNQEFFRKLYLLKKKEYIEKKKLKNNYENIISDSKYLLDQEMTGGYNDEFYKKLYLEKKKEYILKKNLKNKI